MTQHRTNLTNDGAAVTSPDRHSSNLSDLLHRLTTDITKLFRLEVALARAEISQSLKTVLLGSAFVAAAGAILYAGFLLLLLSAVFGLGKLLPLWVAALSVGLAVTLIGCIVLFVGLRKLKSADLIPTHSTRSLLRDKEVLTRTGS